MVVTRVSRHFVCGNDLGCGVVLTQTEKSSEDESCCKLVIVWSMREVGSGSPASSRLKPTKNWLSLETGGVYGLAEAACQTSFRDMRACEMRLISMACV